MVLQRQQERGIYCAICLCHSNDYTTLTACSHSFCTGCLQHMLSSEHSSCPRCQTEIPRQQMKRLLGSGHPLTERLAERSLRQYVAVNRKQLALCPAPDCDFLAEVDADLRRQAVGIVCPVCGTTFCTACNEPHDPRQLLCEQFALQSTAIASSAALKCCPCCDCPIEKTGGCPHMHCSHCGSDFCWHCGSQWTLGHHCVPTEGRPMGTHLHQLQLRYLRRNRSEAEDIRLHFDAAGARQLGGSSLYTVVALQTAAASCAPATGQLCLIEGVSVTLQGVLQRHRLLGYTPMVELDRDGLQLWFVEEAAAGGSTYRGLLFRRQ